MGEVSEVSEGTQPSARVLLDSVSPRGDRITTMEVVMHRFVLAEFNTHRAFSRNSANSRAIAVAKMIERVVIDPALPISWTTEQRGMQGGEELNADHAYSARLRWITARDNAVHYAWELHDIGVHKSVVNRLLEPFMWHTVIVTGDAEGYENFFAQRCLPCAQPELRVAAEEMAIAYAHSLPRRLDYGEWHTPLITDDDMDLINDAVLYLNTSNLREVGWQTLAQRVSAARCARVSYMTHEGRRDVAEDLKLYDRLVSAEPPHWAPLEHVCTPDEVIGEDCIRPERVPTYPRNLHGWVQLRHIVESKLP